MDVSSESANVKILRTIFYISYCSSCNKVDLPIRGQTGQFLGLHNLFSWSLVPDSYNLANQSD